MTNITVTYNPETHVLVPRDPTIKILTALHKKAWPELSSANRERTYAEGYKAMIAAYEREQQGEK